MASEVNICNLALAHLGDVANVASISPSDGSQQADLCVQFYPIARDQLISMHAWNFATKRAALALLSTTELPDTWAYAYAAPAGALNVISVLMPQTANTVSANNQDNSPFGQTTESGDLAAQEFVQEVLQAGTKVIFTNVQYAECRYTTSISDTTKFSGLFITALARLLASYLAGPILKGETGIKVAAAHLKSFFQVEFPLAASMDQKGQRVNTYRDHIPAALQARQ